MKETRVDTLILIQKANLSLSHLLAENTPVFIKDHGRGALATISFRGTSPSHTQVNWNGLPINSPMLGMVDFSLLPVYIIDDMSLHHGTASISQQSGGLGGAVNLYNKPHWDTPFSVRYMQGIGSYRTFDEFLQIAGGRGKFHASTRLYHNYSKNDYPFLNRAIPNIDPHTGEITHPISRNTNADYKRYGLLQEAYLRINPVNMFSVKYWGQYAYRTIPKATSYEGPENSNHNTQDDNDHKAIAEWNYYAPRGKLSVMTGYNQKLLTYLLENAVSGLGTSPEIYSVSKHRGLFNRASYNHELTKSFSVEGNISFNHHNVSSRDTVLDMGYAQKRNELSTFLALRKNLVQRLNLNLMVRQDWVDGLASPIIPFFGFDYKIFKNRDLLLKGNIARNYHQPTLNDLYWQPGGNPDLLPEQGQSVELGLQYLTKFYNHYVEAEVTGFHSIIDHWIIWLPTYKGYWEPHNIKQVLSKGVEVQLVAKGNFNRWAYHVSGTYAYTRAINYGDPLVWGDNSYGKQLVYTPLHSGNAMVRLSHSGYHITWQHISYSERFTTSSNDVSRRDWLYPYFMNDLALGKEFVSQKFSINAELRIQNLFNETYHSVLYRPMPGRNFMFLLALKI